MKSGFVSIIGRPNVGKSTLINALIGRKVSIITPKPQTTRNTVQGILHKEGLQIIFVDTPGIHKPHQRLGEAMNRMAYGSLYDIDAILLVVDSGLPFGPGDVFMLEKIKQHENVIIVFNKIDTTTYPLITSLKETYAKWLPKARQIEISAIRLANLEEIVNTLAEQLPEGPAYFPEDVYTNYPEAFSMSEIIREKVMLLTKQEVPHSIAVQIDRIEDKGHTRNIGATIIVEKDSQKGILIGQGGQMIKRIGTLARRELENDFGRHVILELYVRVEDNWRDSLLRLKEFGYN
ncbi:MAG: GTPase Era [Bacilli bacterium]|jgi:GTP-binding protein Era